MLQVIVLVNLVAAVALSLYYRSGDVFPHLLGLILGGLVSVAMVILLEKTVNKIIYGKKMPAGFAQLSYLLRFALALFALLVGSMVESISLLGVIIGIFSYQIGTYSLGSTLSNKQKQIKDEMSGAGEKEEADKKEE